MVSNIDSSIQSLMKTIEEMKPAYVHALKIMNTANNPTQDQKNNLVFYGLPPEPLEKQMEKEPEFCRDILETRIKMVFREHLKISRDIPFMTVYRFTQATTDPDEVKSKIWAGKFKPFLGKKVLRSSLSIYQNKTKMARNSNFV